VNSVHGEDLGHGVYASPGSGGELTVTSPRLEFPWRIAEGQVPGTAVLWRGQSFEVVGRVAAGNGARWVLSSWDEPTTMRNVFRLDRESVQGAFDDAQKDVRDRQSRGWTLLALPVLGFAPAALQKKWANDWGFAASQATMMSAVIEMVVGAAGTVQMIAAAFGTAFFMPWILAFPGPVLFMSGSLRLARVFGDGEPIGSPIGVVFLPWVPKDQPREESLTPTLRSFEESEGTLALVSPILRRDWDRDGSLRYRDQYFRLETVEQEGRSWVYRFIRVSRRGPEEHPLSLKPPMAAAPEDRQVESPPSFLRTMLMTAAMTLAPASDQRRWAEELGTRAIWFTILGGLAELVGGFVNLRSDLGSQPSLLALVDFYLVGEGLLRFGSALAGRPMGSVFGWLLRPLYRKHLPPESGTQ
jgi:hypothetical protein